MYKHCNTEESARRQRQLEHCLLDLLVDSPYCGITIGQICELAGVSRKSFYRYFDSKDGCLHALLDHIIMDAAPYCLSSSGEVFSDPAFCTRIFEFWQQHTPLLDALERDGLSLQIPQRVMHYILTEEPEYARSMGIPQNLAIEHIIYNVSGLMGLVLSWHHTRYPKTAAQMGEVLYQLMQPKMT